MKLLLIYFQIILLVGLTSCRQYRYVYAGSKINTPMLKEKNESRINGSYSSGESKGVADSSHNRAIDFQAAYALSNHFALTAAYVSRNESDQFSEDFNTNSRSLFSSSFIRYRRQFTEIGAGYFFQHRRNTVLSLYGGAGFGRLRFDDSGLRDSLLYSRQFSAQMMKVFIQPGVSFLKEKGISIDLSMRFSWVDYSNIQSSYTATEEELLHLNGLGSANPILFVEPAFTFSIPAPKLNWLRIEAGYNTVLNYTYWNVRNANFFIGLTTDPFKLIGKKKD